jgi:hypothetical protein
MATKEFKYWKAADSNTLPEALLEKLALQDAEFGTEFEIVNEWYPLFKVTGKNPRQEILKLWKELYPERAAKNKCFMSIQKKLNWWDDHTNFRLFKENKHKVVTLEVMV